MPPAAMIAPAETAEPAAKTATADKAEAYLPQLDGVRAIAVLLVLVQHWVANPFQLGAPFGFVGVTMFFVLSGYLISRILFQAKDRQDRFGTSIGKSLRIFYARRFLRIFPIYYLTIFLLYLFRDPVVRESIGWLLTYTINFKFMQFGDRRSIGHLWSLAIEEQYYLIYPFIVLFCTVRQRVWVLGAMCAAAIGSRIVLDRMGVGINYNKFFTLACFDSFALGGLLAHWESVRGKASVQEFFRKPWVGVATGAICGAFVLFWALRGDVGSGRVIWFRSMVSLASLYVVGLALVESKALGRVLGNPVMVYLGKISYGIYLYHPYSHHVLYLVFPGAEKWAYPLLATSFVGVTMVVSTASWFLFEKPINSLKSRFKY